MRKNKEEIWEDINESFKILLDQINFDRAVQLSTREHEAQLIMLVDSLKKENKSLMVIVNSLHTKLNHVSQSYISQLDIFTQTNENIKTFFLDTDKDKELLRKESLTSIKKNLLKGRRK